ncbi:hypothetical protein OUZ56_006498 [Daphnia magna]|uniref:Uncharacterized protein n=1 Tax=Daphnia magna TaxID=35525 RepID=A0ABQ9YVU6_9CRUS|nr:hypothetical protein OUZ56_006498 [Daphnia magna]
MHYSYLEIISTFKGKSEEGILFLDIKDRNLSISKSSASEQIKCTKYSASSGNLRSSNASINRMISGEPLAEYNKYYQFSRARGQHRLIIILNQKRYILERDFKTITAGRACGNFKGRYLHVTFSR